MLDKNDLFEIKKKKKKNGHSKIIIGGLVYYAPNKSVDYPLSIGSNAKGYWQ